MSANDDALFGRFEPVARDTWRAVVERDLAGASFERRLVTRTAEGLALQPLYEADDESTTPNIARSSSHVLVIQRHAQADPEAARLAIAETPSWQRAQVGAPASSIRRHRSANPTPCGLIVAWQVAQLAPV